MYIFFAITILKPHIIDTVVIRYVVDGFFLNKYFSYLEILRHWFSFSYMNHSKKLTY